MGKASLCGRTLGLVAVAGLALSGGCTVGPDYQRPRLQTPSSFAEAHSGQNVTITPDEADLGSWWSLLGDAELDRLVRDALAGNPDLAAAAARVRAARQEIRIARAAELPTLSASANTLTFNSNRGSTSSGAGAAPTGAAGAGTAAASGGGGATGAGALPLPGSLNFYSLGFDASWEVDLFGGTRRSIEAARANAEASEWARRDAEVTLSAEVVSDYVSLRALQIRAGLIRNEIARESSLFALVRARREAGFVTNLDVNQQRVQLESASAELPSLEAEARAQMHALSVLTGRPPQALVDALSAGAPALPPAPRALAVGLPSDLLRRRPDVREAERRVAAANAQIGVQVAQQYPTLDLLALGSLASSTLTNFFAAQNLQSAALGTLSQPIFNGGRSRASIREAREQRTEASFAYETAVLGAVRDVEDALARYRADQARADAVARSLSASQGSLSIATAEYETGLQPFINVIQAENTVLQTQDQLAQVKSSQLSDLASLFKALGGGWSAEASAAKEPA